MCLTPSTSSKDRDSEGAAVLKHPLSGSDRAPVHKSGFVKRNKAQTHHWTDLMMLSPVRVIDLRQAHFPRHASVASEMISVWLILARDHDRISDQTAARSDSRSTTADNCGPTSSTDVF